MNKLKAVIRDVFFFSGMILWLSELVRIWITGKYLYKDTSGALSYSFVMYLIFSFTAVAHYLANKEGYWLLWLKKMCRDITFLIGTFVLGISGVTGVAYAQFVLHDISSRDLQEIIGSFLAHGLLLVIPLVAHYISKQ